MELKRKIACSLLLSGLSGSVLAEPSGPWPKATTDYRNMVINSGTINIKVLENDAGAELSLTEVNQYSKNGGTAYLSADKLSINYTPDKSINLQGGDASSVDSFWYVFKDKYGRTNSTKVTVNRLTTWWPQSKPDTATIDANSFFQSISVLNNDVGVELYINSTNAYSKEGGNVKITQNKQQILYKPPANFTGTDKLWYLIKDAAGRVNSASVTITVKDIYTGWPEANPDSTTLTNGLPKIIPVLDNDKGLKLTLKSTNDWTQNGGRSEIFGNSIKYTPPSNFTGTDAFWYVFEDSKGRTNSAKVTIEVSNGADNSVIQFCGNSYETDGTKENTKLTGLWPIPILPPVVPSPIIGDVVDIGNRRYQIFGDGSALPQALRMTVDGDQVVTIATSSANQSIYLIGSHDGKIYFVVDNATLYSHDGQQLEEVASLNTLANIGQYEQLQGVEFAPSVTHDFYFKVVKNTSFQSFNYKTGSIYRVSDAGLPVFVGTEVNGNRVSGEVNSEISKLYFFDGLDYYRFSQSGSGLNGQGAYSIQQTVQRKNGAILNTLDVFPEYIFENNGRLFVITEATPARPADSRNPARDAVPSTLYTVDGEDNFVELVVCN